MILISSFFLSTVEAQREKQKLKVDKEERRAIRNKNAVQKANQQAGIEAGSDGDFEPRDNPSVIHFSVLTDIKY